jgi:hypothetical protein
MQSLAHSGVRPFLAIIGATLVALATSLGAAYLLF